MERALDIEIRDRLASYLVGEISLQDFEHWFVPSSWNIVQSKNQAAVNLVYEIELWLAEYSDGFWSEDELKDQLRPLVENYRIELEPHSGLELGSNARVERWSLSAVSFDILYVEASL